MWMQRQRLFTWISIVSASSRWWGRNSLLKLEGIHGLIIVKALYSSTQHIVYRSGVILWSCALIYSEPLQCTRKMCSPTRCHGCLWCCVFDAISMEVHFIIHLAKLLCSPEFSSYDTFSHIFAKYFLFHFLTLS